MFLFYKLGFVFLFLSLVLSFSLFVCVSPSDIKEAVTAGARAPQARLPGRTVQGLGSRVLGLRRALQARLPGRSV